MHMKKTKKDFTFIDLFAGIGGLRKAFEPYGECLFSSELNKYSKITYCENFPESLVLGDISGDSNINILDIVQLANCILVDNCSDLPNGCAGDLNDDGNWNILDIVQLANLILNN